MKRIGLYEPTSGKGITGCLGDCWLKLECNEKRLPPKGLELIGVLPGLASVHCEQYW